MSYLSPELWRLNHQKRDLHNARDPLNGDDVHCPRKRRQNGPALACTTTAASTSTSATSTSTFFASSTSAASRLLLRLLGGADPETPHQVLSLLPHVINVCLKKLLQLRVRSCKLLDLPQRVLAHALHERKDWPRD